MYICVYTYTVYVGICIYCRCSFNHYITSGVFVSQALLQLCADLSGETGCFEKFRVISIRASYLREETTVATSIIIIIST